MSPEVSAYIAQRPEAGNHLNTIRLLVNKAVKDGEEVISYGIPTVKKNGKFVVYFAGYKTHVSIHPIPAGNAAFQKAISPYVAGKGTLRFPLDKPLPASIIKRVIKQSVKAYQERVKTS